MNEKDITRVKVSAEDFGKDEGDWEAFDNLSDEEVLALAESDPDALPTSAVDLQRFERVVNVKEIRRQLDMTQEEFAGVFHLSLATLRDWEQARTQPDQAARTLLKVIAHNPEVVREALAG
ncbi:MAG TPA: helix-turn-helix domain-containing protein [Chloroflexota bacterium]|nr:helix-turn-helix domain-containing protein [Chloroflexota bacterium]HUM71493.1 helix-turn-helix domain-containing protein [Chloroflexota bacterium]